MDLFLFTNDSQVNGQLKSRHYLACCFTVVSTVFEFEL